MVQAGEARARPGVEAVEVQTRTRRESSSGGSVKVIGQLSEGARSQDHTPIPVWVDGGHSQREGLWESLK